MDQNKELESGVVVKGRVTIDRRPPFPSVKAAVALFGERVLAGEIRARHLKEMRNNNKASNEGEREATKLKEELEETKKSLQKARAEGSLMATHLKSLRDELHLTQRQLFRAFKSIPPGSSQPSITPEIEEIKFVETKTRIPPPPPPPPVPPVAEEAEEVVVDHGVAPPRLGFEVGRNSFNKKFVRFASPLSLAREMYGGGGGGMVERTTSFRREEEVGVSKSKKKKGFHVMGWLFPIRKKRPEYIDDSSQRS